MDLVAWIGRQRTRAVAALVAIAIALPSLGAILKPYVTEAVVGLLCIAFLRIDVEAFRSYLRQPGSVVAAAVWTSFAIPMLFGLGCWIAGFEAISPALFLGLMLQAVASPMMAAPALAALMGLDATLVLCTLIVSTVITPISAPLFVYLMGLDLSLSPLSLGLKLMTILAGSAVVGLLIRRLLGADAIARHRDRIDGVNVLILFVFVSAVMGEVGIRFLDDPIKMLALTVFAFAVFALLLAVTYLVFLKWGSKRAFALGMMTSQRNMGLMLAATGGILPDLTWLYFAVSQFPIYLSPQVLQPVARAIARRER
ncbi:Na+-dependent transporter [Pelagibius sp. Alg239-R121]|uniref:Na+-dependent transporter n=1 Tax=Pelagibius sp. Alg239-R121 TaxID=2993448 RepID=UPI0024A632A6|nr:Na+-dependent transporter [Pelagibius sp. Alg239-R121]